MKEVENFEKEQLDKLISDLKDINQYTSFKNGAFIYDLGKYQGNLLTNYIEKIEQENQQLKIQINDREEECKKLVDKLIETENWLRTTILQLMEITKQNYFWITDQQIDNAKLVKIIFTITGDGSVKFKKVESGVSDVED